MKRTAGVRRVVMWYLGIFLSSAMATYAEVPTVEVYLIKAAFIYNFAKFIEWPLEAFAQTPTQLTLCIPNEALIREAFASIQGKSVQGRRILLKPLLPSDDAHVCHILFLRAGHSDAVRQALQPLQHAPILIVGEAENIVPYGGMIHFLTIEDKIRFIINVKAIKQAGLTVSSKLLQLAYQLKH
jgi:hypothetical protein